MRNFPRHVEAIYDYDIHLPTNNVDINGQMKTKETPE